MRIGAVNYLNSKPLVCGLESLAPRLRLTYDLPSRLAESLAAGRLDVALVPSVEYLRGPGYRIVSDACVACRGPVLSVKLFFRVPPSEVRRVALDEGSRTSAALTQILLAELCGTQPQWEPLPIGCGFESTSADAVLLIGDRAIRGEEPGMSSAVQGGNEFYDVWDLGEQWRRWTGLPFVFAMWVARGEVELSEAAELLTAARDEGVGRVEEIALREAETMGISRELAVSYLRDTLHFKLGRDEHAGLRRYYQLCVAHGLAPAGLEEALVEAEARLVASY